MLLALGGRFGIRGCEGRTRAAAQPRAQEPSKVFDQEAEPYEGAGRPIPIR
jgi:hypothetical protein